MKKVVGVQIKLDMPELIVFYRILDRIIKDGVSLGSNDATQRSVEEVRLAEKPRREILKVHHD